MLGTEATGETVLPLAAFVGLLVWVADGLAVVGCIDGCELRVTVGLADVGDSVGTSVGGKLKPTREICFNRLY